MTATFNVAALSLWLILAIVAHNFLGLELLDGPSLDLAPWLGGRDLGGVVGGLLGLAVAVSSGSGLGLVRSRSEGVSGGRGGSWGWDWSRSRLVLGLLVLGRSSPRLGGLGLGWGWGDLDLRRTVTPLIDILYVAELGLGGGVFLNHYIKL